MSDRNIGIYTAIAALLWPTGFIVVCVGLFTGIEVGQLGIVLCMIAATLTVRGYFCALTRRERNAFELGRDYAEIRSLRR